MSLTETLKKSGKDALGGGIPGMVAMSTQVITLMWLRTTINYQYRYGMSMRVAMRALYKEGGVMRFYKGLAPALIQAPLSRFGDTAANAGVLSLLNSHDSTRMLPLGLKTLAASVTAAGFRLVLMPIDTVKTSLQVDGDRGWGYMAQKYKQHDIKIFYRGSLAASAATFASHYPWFLTYNTMTKAFPDKQSDALALRLARSAAIGFCATVAADCCANSVRVVKTTRQTLQGEATYLQIIRTIVEKDGVLGLMGRGLLTKIAANGAQGITFSIVWRLAQDAYQSRA
jgi:hypothetical protein